jgi:hypothetical protein
VVLTQAELLVVVVGVLEVVDVVVVDVMGGWLEAEVEGIELDKEVEDSELDVVEVSEGG